MPENNNVRTLYDTKADLYGDGTYLYVSHGGLHRRGLHDRDIEQIGDPDLYVTRGSPGEEVALYRRDRVREFAERDWFDHFLSQHRANWRRFPSLGIEFGLAPEPHPEPEPQTEPGKIAVSEETIGHIATLHAIARDRGIPLELLLGEVVEQQWAAIDC